MRHISSHIKRAAFRQRVTERGEIMKYFCERLNTGRIRDGYPRLTYGRMGKMLEGIPTKDLYYLKKICDDAKDFSKTFWWQLNPKKHEEK